MLFVHPPSSPFEPPSLLFHFLSSPLRFLTQHLYHLILLFRGSSITPPNPSSRIRLVCISDTHSKRTVIPDGDVLIHAGDLANEGSAREIQDQIDWVASLPHQHKIVIAGNHDGFLDPQARLDSDSRRSIDFKDVHYLQHSGIKITFPQAANRRLSFYGAPHIPACGGDDFAFQYPRQQDAWSGTVPRSIDVLITHTPPRHHLDLPHGMGCEFLLEEVWQVKPKLHVFGHVHCGYGQESLFWDEGQKAYERVCSRAQAGLFRDCIDLLAWFDVVKVLLYGIKGFLWSQVWGGVPVGTLAVNASLTVGSTGKLGNAPQVVDL
ncbi:MAG: hypothetical protein LQ337_002342 [Flavoplaca oasis]|nr:MAG: hypothetical protein LQ337_002342 [Flavoplaca oasis]